jgi:uncharacterized PurR-regulated membrane protein YhhQ (DUF165 family)
VLHVFARCFILRQRRRANGQGRGIVHIDAGNGLGAAWNRAADTGARRDYGRPFMMSSNVAAPPARTKELSAAVRAFHAIRRTVLPVLGLLTAVFAVFLYADTKLPFLDRAFAGWDAALLPSQWLLGSLILAPVTFLPLHFTSRRYGPSIALSALAVTWLLVASIVLASAQGGLDGFRILPPLGVRESIALASALIASQFVAVLVFDGARCIRWWQAPLMASLWGSFVFAGIFHPASAFGAQNLWLGQMGIHFGVMVLESLALLVPYWMFRRLIRPLPGFAGY